MRQGEASTSLQGMKEDWATAAQLAVAGRATLRNICFFYCGPLICNPERTPFLLAQFDGLLSHGLGRRCISRRPCQGRTLARAARSASRHVFFFSCAPVICYPNPPPL